MAKTDTAQAVQPAVEADSLDETRVGSFAGWGATVAVFHGDLLSHLEYPPAPTERRYQVDPVTGLIVGRIT